MKPELKDKINWANVEQPTSYEIHENPEIQYHPMQQADLEQKINNLTFIRFERDDENRLLTKYMKQLIEVKQKLQELNYQKAA